MTGIARKMPSFPPLVYLLNLKCQMQKEIYEIYLSYRSIQLILFWVFGFYGWGVVGGHSLTILALNLSTNAVIAISMVQIFRSRSYFQNLSRYRFALKVKHLTCLIISSLAMLIVNRDIVQAPLTVDEIAYAWASQGHAYTLLFETTKLLGIETSNFPGNNYIHIISLLLMCFSLISFRVLAKIRSERFFIFVVLSSLLVLRVCISLLSSGGTGYHAPLAFTWSWALTSIFGFSSIAFRITSISLLAFLTVYLVYRIKHENRFQALVAALTISLLFTAPLLRFMSQEVEVAIWTFVVTIILCVELIHNKFYLSREQLVIFSLLTYVRIDIASLMIALLLMMLIKLRGNPRLALSHIMPSLIIILPGIYIYLTFGIRDRTSEFSSSDILLVNFQNAIRSLSDSKSFAYLPLFLFAFYVLLVKKESRLFTTLVAMSYFVLFFVLNQTSFSFSAKYLVEWYFPYVLLAPILILLSSKNSSILPRYFLIMFLITVNLVGVYNSSIIKDRYREVYSGYTGAISSGYSVLPFTPFAYDEVFDYIKARNNNLCLNVGAVYSMVPEVLGGMPLDYLYTMKIRRNAFIDIQRKQNEAWASVSADSLMSADVSCVILGAVENQAESLSNLRNNGWAIEKTFRNSEFGTSVHILTLLTP